MGTLICITWVFVRIYFHIAFYVDFCMLILNSIVYLDMSQRKIQRNKPKMKWKRLNWEE